MGLRTPRNLPRPPVRSGAPAAAGRGPKQAVWTVRPRMMKLKKIGACGGLRELLSVFKSAPAAGSGSDCMKKPAPAAGFEDDTCDKHLSLPPLPHARRFARAARGPFAARHRLLWVSASIQGLSRIPLLIFIHWGSLVSVHSRGCAPGGSLRRGPIHQMWRPADAAWEEWSLFGKATALGAISSLSLFFPSPWAPRAAALEQLRILGGAPL